MSIGASVLAALASRAATAAAVSLLGGKIDSDSLIPEDAFAYIADTAAGEPLIVSERQRVSIDKFLERSEVAELLSSWLILKLGEDVNGEVTIVLGDMGYAFEQMVIRWNKGAPRENDWSSLGRQIWELATLTFEATTFRLRSVITSDSKLSELYQRYNFGARLLRGSRHASPAHIRRLAALLASPTVLLEAPPLIDEIKAIAAAKFGELNLGHVQDADDRFDDALLYVDRSVIDSAARATEGSIAYIETNSIISQDHVARAIIIGDPGVGKSTFVRHVIYTLAKSSAARMAPLLVNCREYAAQAGAPSIVKYIVDSLVLDSSSNFSEEGLKTVLTLGAACVVFDGVDEIIDLQRRRDFIRMIEGFANTYPYVSIISSTRRVGYQQARFGKNFQVLELDEFTPAEFKTYVESWFRLTGRDDQEARAFMRESEDIKDIRKNPLMLSLLCTLYRARGHIPRNRRQVYRDCADLLFVRWDSMRHVEQPFDHRQYGNRLMQELARFFYRTQSAQGGLEEGQLVRLIAHFFRDTASVAPPDDENRARQFLEFCAGRAWLLSRKGTNSRGIRLFSFTHRTFMEYMAAEALVRIAPDIEAIATSVMDVFMQDPSSVIPDVMAQAADDKFERGAEQTLRILVERSGKSKGLSGDKFLALCLRIVNSAPMSRLISDSLPGLIMHFWSKADDLNATRESTFAFFELYRDPRTRIVSALEGREPITWISSTWPVEEFRIAVLSRWIRVNLLDRSETLDPGWRDAVNSLHGDATTRPAGSIGSYEEDAVVKDLLLNQGHLSPADAKNSNVRVPAVCVSIFGERLGGSVIRSIGRLLCGEKSVHDSEIIDWFGQELRYVKFARVWLPGACAIADALQNEAQHWGMLKGKPLDAALSDSWNLQRTLWWLFCLMDEADRYKAFSGFFGSLSLDFAKIADFRRRTMTEVGVGDHSVSELKWAGYSAPGVPGLKVASWATRWAYGTLDLVAKPDEFPQKSTDGPKVGQYLAPYILERTQARHFNF